VGPPPPLAFGRGGGRCTPPRPPPRPPPHAPRPGPRAAPLYTAAGDGYGFTTESRCVVSFASPWMVSVSVVVVVTSVSVVGTVVG
jgi:hypothetical protein